MPAVRPAAMGFPAQPCRASSCLLAPFILDRDWRYLQHRWTIDQRAEWRRVGTQDQPDPRVHNGVQGIERTQQAIELGRAGIGAAIALGRLDRGIGLDNT